MPKHIAVVIQEDPRKTHRPVEALRIALGMAAGSHETTVILLSEAPRLLSEDTEDVVDSEILEKYLPSIEHLHIPFLLSSETNYSGVRTSFSLEYKPSAEIRAFLRSMDRVLVF